MKMHISGFLTLVIGLTLARCSTAQEKGEDALTKALKDAEVVFTGKIGKVNPLGQTNSIPPSTFGNVSQRQTSQVANQAQPLADIDVVRDFRSAGRHAGSSSSAVKNS